MGKNSEGEEKAKKKVEEGGWNKRRRVKEQ